VLWLLAVSTSYFIASNERVFANLWFWKETVVLFLKLLLKIFLKSWGRPPKILQDQRRHVYLFRQDVVFEIMARSSQHALTETQEHVCCGICFVTRVEYLSPCATAWCTVLLACLCEVQHQAAGGMFTGPNTPASTFPLCSEMMRNALRLRYMYSDCHSMLW
jgi:hypothetical protein